MTQSTIPLGMDQLLLTPGVIVVILFGELGKRKKPGRLEKNTATVSCSYVTAYESYTAKSVADPLTNLQTYHPTFHLTAL